MIRLPEDYRKMREIGLLSRLTDPDDPLCIWDAEFLLEQEIGSYERLYDQIVEITPFAITGSGDYWAYLTDALPNPEIVLCFHDSYEAEWYANCLCEFIFKRTVQFAGTEALSESSHVWNLSTAKEMLSLVASSFGGLLSDEMASELVRIANSQTINGGSGWVTLIPEEEAARLIARFAPPRRSDVTFEWRE